MKGTALNLSELFDMELLEQRIKEGYVKKTLHPELPLGILNYTDAATYDGVWDDVTTHCRGLIYRLGSGEVIARGPRKFFNYGEPNATNYPLSTQVRVTRKEDGSLGIGWLWEDGDDWHWGIATRGSFTSEQALHATDLVQSGDDYDFLRETLEQYSAMGYSGAGEIIYLENRIVLDYAGKDAYLPLGTVDNISGLIMWRPGSALVPGVPAIMSLGDALKLPIPEGEEGYVLDVLDEYLNVVDHIKLKGDWYKEMHAAIFGLTEKRVWEAWGADNSELFESLPDELQGWALNVALRLDDEYELLSGRVWEALADLYGEVGKDAPRSKQAQWILYNHKELAPALFARLDYNDAKAMHWIEKQVKPKGHVPFKASVNA